ncbi:MAG: DUF3488 and transglutaminase-like domain-containing protein [Steroidobacteraceae bacterium]
MSARAELSPRQTQCIALAFAMSLLLHLDRMPTWTIVAAIAAVAYRLAMSADRARPPGRIAMLLLVLTLLGAVFAQFRTLNGLAAGSSLLGAMGALKLLEARTTRDAQVVAGSAIFLLLAACLDRQGMIRMPLYGAVAWLTLAAMAIVSAAGAGLSTRAALRMSARSIGLALPIAIMGFLFFPRIAGSFWATPGGGAASTGLADSMSPGSITELVDSDAVAFRVQFTGRAPPSSELYFRGPVMMDFDGYTWRARRASYMEPALSYRGPSYSYTVALEPHDQRWLFALEMPTPPRQRGMRMAGANELTANEPVGKPISYRLTSYTRAGNSQTLRSLGRRFFTALPAGRNPRTLELARRMRREAGSDLAFSDAVLSLFASTGFEYSLTPPRLDYNSVDDFLFNSRRGFCGHFASAYVSMMRAAGVPARVVTGYLGGEWNPIGRHFTIRQSDAHAWAEIWLDARGWTRVDPTAVVAPERLTRGASELLSDSGSFTQRLVLASTWLRGLRRQWDAANAWWTQRIIEFNSSSQRSLLQSLGLRDADLATAGRILAIGFVIWLIALGAWQARVLLYRGNEPLQRSYRLLLAKLARAGIPIRASESAAALSMRLRMQRPQASALLEQYASLRYGRPSATAPSLIAGFGRAVRRYRATDAEVA